jgi:hypothetical protein
MVSSRTPTAVPFCTKTGLQSENVFRLRVDCVRHYAIFLLYAGGVIASWNPGAEKLKNLAASEVIRKQFSVFYGTEDLNRMRLNEEPALTKEA